ncbi:MAG: thermonuclease family protein [Mailhella sp.]|nr:thermonuclease family protein [Mailhella sp.]
MKKRKATKPGFGGGRYYWAEIFVLCLLLTAAAALYDQTPFPSPRQQRAAPLAKKTETHAVSSVRATPDPAKTPRKEEQKTAALHQKPEPRREPAKASPQAEKKAAHPAPDSAAKPQKPATQTKVHDLPAVSSADSDEEYSVVRVDDGDSLELADRQNRRFRVRLYGIDAPEGKQSFGHESRSNMQRLTKGKKVLLKRMYTDNYQRTVAIVFLSAGGKADALSLNERQVQDGMAWVYDFFCTSSECNTWKFEEAMAKNRKIGLWKNPSPIPPWQWRSVQNN